MGSKTKSSGCPLYRQAGDVAQGNSLHDGDVAGPEGSISELFAWCSWKREWGRACVCLLAQGWGRTGVALP